MASKRWNHESILFLLILIVALIGLYGATKLPLTARFTIGPGMAPLVYGALVLFISAVLIVQALRSKNPQKLIPPSGKKGLLFVLFMIIFAILSYIIGFVISMFIFSALVLVYVEGWQYKKALPFALVWTFALYWFFVRILSVPLLTGMLFGS